MDAHFHHTGFRDGRFSQRRQHGGRSAGGRVQGLRATGIKQFKTVTCSRQLACQLARAGHSLELFDAGGPEALNSAARAAAAMLAPLAESATTETSGVEMGVQALNRWPELIAQRDERFFFQKEGTLVLWHRKDAA